MDIMGIDPGFDGGVACIKDTGYSVSPMPIDELDGKRIIDPYEIRHFIEGWMPDRIVMENVHSMPKQGVASTFNFGKNFGMLLSICLLYDADLILVPPQRWKKEILGPGKHTKEDSIEKVKILLPKVQLFRTSRCKKEHDGMAEALLIAEYGRRLLC